MSILTDINRESDKKMLAKTWDREVDLLVIGAGAAGMAAAVAGAVEGLNVAICESSTQVGGTAATSAGSLWIPGNEQSLAAGYEDSQERGRRYLSTLLGAKPLDSAQLAYFEHAPAVIQYFEKNSSVRFMPCGRHPDYQDLDGAAVSGRAIVPQPFDGRLLGAEFERVRPPITEFMVMGGLMLGKDDIARLLRRYESAANFMHGARLVLRYLADRLRFSRGTRLVMGNALVARLYHSLLHKGVRVDFETRLLELVKSGDEVVGALLLQRGAVVRIRATKGVVLATGGFAHNRQMRARYMPKPTPFHSLACPTNLGEGVDAGLRAGGHVDPGKHKTGAFWSPTSMTRRADGSSGLFPHLLLDRAKPGIVAVNAAGKRFVNEGVSYHHFVEAMFAADQSTPAIPAFLVCTKEFVRKYGLGVIRPGTARLEKYCRTGVLAVDETVDGLARKIGVDAAGLQETIDRNNRFAASGIDEDFGKGSTELNRFNGDPEHGPNPCLGPIAAGPFCAVAVWPAEIACSTGLQTNEHAQVLNESEKPVPGLYACGNDMASVMQGTYPGPGTTLGPAFVFAWLAVQHARGGTARQQAAALAAERR
jgi:succinate dehydrogenase/fumarate reductase flavoprotein subunit